ncbi:MAG: ATP synthase F1 subunit epsilon [Pseudomonadota bacterium]
MATFSFELVSPEALLISGEVEEVTLPGAEGEFQVLAGHAPFLALLGPGIVEVSGGSVERQRIFIDGGFCDVNDGGCSVLAEAAHDASGAAEKVDAIIAEAKAAAQGELSGNALDEAQRRIATLESVKASL